MKNWSWTARERIFSGKRGEKRLLLRCVNADEVDKVLQLQQRDL